MAVKEAIGLLPTVTKVRFKIDTCSTRLDFILAEILIVRFLG